jgi:hypothetical protein
MDPMDLVGPAETVVVPEVKSQKGHAWLPVCLTREVGWDLVQTRGVYLGEMDGGG